MTALWTAEEIARATGGAINGDFSARGVSIDTRTLAPGDLFVALKAARDGHDFVAEALRRGAAGALVSRRPEGVPPDAPLVVVPDVQAALEALGRAGRARSAARVIAVTGSAGKTSTKEMLRVMLAGQGRVHAAEASYNNHWGVPLTLARMPAATDFAIVEIGMNNPGEIAPLSRLARPHVALITTIAPAHLAAFDDVAGIAREKATILQGLEPGGRAVLPADVETAPVLAAAAEALGVPVSWFGTTAGDWRLIDWRLAGGHTTARAEGPDGPLLYKVASAGRHFAANALGAIAAAALAGADPALSVTDLGRWRPVSGRGAEERILLDPVDPASAVLLIDESYNANPASMAAALEVLAAHPRGATGRRGRRIAYLGDMKELGPAAEALHADLAAHPAMAGIDVVHAIGPLARALHAALPPQRRGEWRASAVEMAGEVHRHLRAGDVVLAKGSLSTGLAEVVDAIRKLGHRVARSSPEEF